MQTTSCTMANLLTCMALASLWQFYKLCTQLDQLEGLQAARKIITRYGVMKRYVVACMQAGPAGKSAVRCSPLQDALKGSGGWPAAVLG